MREGNASDAASPPSMAIFLDLSQRAQRAESPAEFAPISQAPYIGASRPPAGANEQHIPALHAHPGLLLPSIQILWGNHSVDIQVGESLQSRDVHQDTAGE